MTEAKKDEPEDVYMFKILFILQKKSFFAWKTAKNMQKGCIFKIMLKLVVICIFWGQKGFLKNERNLEHVNKIIEAHLIYSIIFLDILTFDFWLFWGILEG